MSAVEFALIAPVMIFMFFGMTELSTAILVQRQVSHSNAAIGDLVAQYGDPTYVNGVAQSNPPAMTPSQMANIFTAANLIIGPYPTAPFQIRITSLVVDSKGLSRVNWSCAPSGQSTIGPLTAVTQYTPPSGLFATASGGGLAPGDTLIMSQTYYPYTSSVNYFAMNGMNFNNTFYFKPRASANGVGFYPGTTPTWSLNWDSSSTAQALNTGGANCSYQTG